LEPVNPSLEGSLPVFGGGDLNGPEIAEDFRAHGFQVEGRSLLSFEQQVKLDLEYIRRRSLLVDLILIARTIPAVLSGRGAF